MRNRRIYETIGVRYSDSAVMAEIVSEVEAMLRGHGEIDQSRTLIVNFVSFGSSSLDFFIYTFTRTTDWVTYHGVKQEILLNILEIIERMGADIAFPTRTVLLDPGGPRLGADDRDA
jgi:MscS family membrane protein